MPVIGICVATGFNSSSYFSKAYRDLFGICPSDAWPDTRTLPEWPELITSFRNNAVLSRA
jgi:AraC-like DNA-binding protein